MGDYKRFQFPFLHISALKLFSPCMIFFEQKTGNFKKKMFKIERKFTP